VCVLAYAGQQNAWEDERVAERGDAWLSCGMEERLRDSHERVLAVVGEVKGVNVVCHVVSWRCLWQSRNHHMQCATVAWCGDWCCCTSARLGMLRGGGERLKPTCGCGLVSCGYARKHMYRAKVWVSLLPKVRRHHKSDSSCCGWMQWSSVDMLCDGLGLRVSPETPCLSAALRRQYWRLR
jgi:hypothetical protein